MTDNDIIKALECFNSKECMGKECPYYKLKPCPFCGYKADVMFYYPFDGYQGEPSVCRIGCLNCRAQIERDTFIKAMIDWNRRVNDD